MPLLNPSLALTQLESFLPNPRRPSARPLATQESSYRTDAEKFGWSFVLELHATSVAKARSNQTVKEAPHWLVVHGAWWRYPGGPGSSIKHRLKYPAVHLSLHDAKAYCRWAGKRLPTETEWEAAARRPHASLTAASQPYPWGSEQPQNSTPWRLNLWQGDFPRIDAALDGYAGLAPADAFSPSQIGLYNMLGNVWEWTGTWFSKSSGQRVLRGGSYLDSADGSFNHKVSCATRMGNTEDSSADNMGVRCAKSVPGAPKLAPRGYAYSQAKRKRPPPGVGDPLKDGGEAAQRMVQELAAERGAEGVQKWMDQMGMGVDVMSAGEAQIKQDEKRRRMEEEMARAVGEEREAHSFEDLEDEDIDKSEL